MFGTELDPANTECGDKEVYHEFIAMTDELRRDLAECRGEQARCRNELERLTKETKDASLIARESFSRANEEKLMLHENGREGMDNLEKRISVLEMEKETIYHMWQLSLQMIKALEQELRLSLQDERGIKFCDERVEQMKEMYSQVIQSLEMKLWKAKEYFTKNQAVLDENKEKVEILTGEKMELEKKLSSQEKEAGERRESDRLLIESLKCEADSARIELDRAREDNLELHEKLQETRRYANVAILRSEEAKRKVEQVLEIAESAIKEKDAAVEAESRARVERAKMEMRLNGIIDEYTTRLDRELVAARESFERGSKKSAVEIKELKVELREKITLMDRLERENKLLEQELEKFRHGTGSLLQRSSANVVDLEEKLKQARSTMESFEDNCRRKYEEKMEEMEARLAASSDRLRRSQLYGQKEFDERIRDADDRTNEMIERYSMLERRLARTLDEKENLATEMRNLRRDHEREIARKDIERRSQETRIRELQDNLQTAHDELDKSKSRAASLMKQIESLQRDLLEKSNPDPNGIESKINQELIARLKTLQDKFDQRTRELTQHVETHQKLCRRWKDEANALTAKFKTRTKEFREEMSIMRKENEALNKELLVCRQQLGACRLQVSTRFNQGDGTR